MKKILPLLLVPIALVGCHQNEQTSQNDGSVNYVETAESTESNAVNQQNTADQTSGVETEDKTIDEINKEEGISAEQIVVKITDNGYVTTHGDHFHAYNGHVPSDALISEGLATEETGESVSDHQAGEVVLVNGEYRFKIEDEYSPLLRSEEEITSQASGNDPGQTWPGAEYRNENGQYTTDDGYVFNPNDVVEETEYGYLIPNGDQNHIIPKDRLTKFEIKAVENHLNQ